MNPARRALLRSGLGLTVAAAAGFAAAPLAFADTDVGPLADPIADLIAKSAGGVMPGARRVAFDNLHTGEKLDIAYWENGSYLPDALREVNYVLRDHRNNEIHTIQPHLLDLLTALSQRMEVAPRFEVISGYRSPETNAMLHAESNEVAVMSLHTVGEAIDIRVAGQDLSYLHRAALGLDMGGVGYYPWSDFVHVDIGRVRQWSGT
jgi:uncharacterized protein YcbK (DUF882 family)